MTILRAPDGPGPSTEGGRPVDGSAPADAPAGERAVSPVLGVALMIAVTVTLVVIVAPVVFAVSGDAGDSSPDAEFGFSYDEGVSPSQTDTFGNTSSDVRAAGMMRIVFEDGENIEAGKITIAGAASGGNLANSPRYAADDPLIPGEEITVWVSRGDDVQIIWDDPDAGRSEVLAEFAVRPTTDLPVFVPEPDEDCDWVEDQLSGGNDLNINGIVVDCDLSQYSINDIDVTDGGAVISDVPVNGNVDLDDGTVYLGDVKADGDVDMDNGAEVGGDIIMDDGSSSNFVPNDARIRGSVVLNGDMDADGTTIRGSVDVTGNINDLSNSVVEDTVTATGKVLLVDGTTVSGAVNSNTQIKLNGGSEIEEDVTVPDVVNDLICSDDDNSLVNGIGCKEYKDPEFAVTIDGANEPVEGDTLQVNATVENTGYENGTATAELFIDGSLSSEDSTSVSVPGQGSTQTTLVWSTASGDAGDHTALVEVGDGADVHDDDSAGVFVASDSRSQDALIFEVGGYNNSLEIQIGDTVPYTATATYDDNSTKDVTDDVNVSVIAGDPSNVTIDDSNNEITGDDADVLTLEANDSSGFTDTVDMTVEPRMDGRTNLVSSSTGTSATFTLENIGSDPVKIAEISVDSVDGSPTKVDNGGDNESVQTDGPGYLNTKQIEIGDVPQSFDTIPEIAGGDTSTFELIEFRNNGGKAKSASNVEMTLYFTDGTQQTYTLP